MSCKDETKTIGEHEFYCRQLPAMDALELKMRLLEMFGQSISNSPALLEAYVVNDEAGMLAGIAGIINGSFAKKSPEEVTKMLCELACYASVDGRRITPKPTEKGVSFDELFSGNFKLLYQVILFVLLVNYRDFLDVRGMIKSAMSRMIQKLKEKPSESTGSEEFALQT